MQYICLYIEIALHNALRYNFAVLGPAVFYSSRATFLP